MNKKLFIFTALILLALAGFLFIAIFRNKPPVNKPASTQKAGLSQASLSAKAAQLEAQGSINEAKLALQELINEFPSSPEIMNWQRKIEELNIRMLFSSAPSPKSASYQIQPGDNLIKIARNFKTTPELIMKSNNLADDKIIPGRKIKVWNAPFSILVDKSQNSLILKSDEEIIKTYVVSTGANNSTPVGTFKIVNKLKDPTWFKSGAVVPAGSPDNVLGSRWMGFDLPGYGIHGTTEPESLGKQVTQGCVRLRNSDVEELYTIVPAGTEVAIVD